MLRHQLASHSLDYLDQNKNEVQAFVPVRIELSGFSCTVTENRGDTSDIFELDKAIEAHNIKLVEVLGQVFEKSVKTVFKGQEKKISEFNSVLADLRFERDGNMIMKAGAGENVTEWRFTVAKST